MNLGGSIYAIGIDGSPYVKIGCTNGAVARRLHQLQRDSTERLRLIGSVAVTADRFQLEGHIHLALAASRAYGEWFRCPMTQARLEILVAEAHEALEGKGHPRATLDVIGMILDHSALSTSAKMVLLTIAYDTDWHLGVSFPSMTRIIHHTGLSYSHVSTLVGDLVHAGYLQMDRGKGPRQGSAYVINRARLVQTRGA